MRRSALTLPLAALMTLMGTAAAAQPPTDAPRDRQLERTEREFLVDSPDTGREHLLSGYQISAPCDADAAIVLLHGLSYTGEAWDIDGYSYARILAAAGYDVVAIDRLGYGRSELEDGRAVTTLGHSAMATRVVQELSHDYEHVVLAGHSAGAETAISAAGLRGAPVSALVSMGYTTFPGPEFLVRDFAADQVAALTDDYVYFLGTPERRAELFYDADHADEEVIAQDTADAVLTPSGEVQTIAVQPGRVGSALVDVPVLLQLADGDELFPAVFAPLWEAQFVAAGSVTTDIVEDAAHTYMTHRGGPAAAERIATWLAETASVPSCSPGTTGGVVDPGDRGSADREPDPEDDPPAPEAEQLTHQQETVSASTSPAPEGEAASDAMAAGTVLPVTGRGTSVLALLALAAAMGLRRASPTGA